MFMTFSARRKRVLLILMSTAVTLLFSNVGNAQTAKPIKVIVPFAPGGGNDVLARQIAKDLSEMRKQAVLVENKPGAGGSIGTEYVVRAPADEITLLLGHTGTVSINPTLLNTGINPLKDLEPLALLASTSLVLVVSQDSKIKSIQDVIELAKQRSSPLTYGSSGNGTGGHLTGEMFKEVTGIKMSHIPYRGTGPALVDVAGGQLDLMFSVIPPALPLIQSGKLRVIAVSSKKRLPIFPDIPTVIESNIKSLSNFDSSVSYGVLSSNKISPAAAKELSAQILKIGSSLEFQSKLSSEGAVPLLGNSAEYAKLIQLESKKWAEVIRKSGAVAD
jgi:tripartite-type tricarboxylate transporter receptor subunit TctC